MIASEAFMDQVLELALDDELEPMTPAYGSRPYGLPEHHQGGDIASGELKTFRKLHGLT
jgi:hypothetical protein